MTVSVISAVTWAGLTVVAAVVVVVALLPLPATTIAATAVSRDAETPATVVVVAKVEKTLVGVLAGVGVAMSSGGAVGEKKLPPVSLECTSDEEVVRSATTGYMTTVAFDDEDEDVCSNIWLNRTHKSKKSSLRFIIIDLWYREKTTIFGRRKETIRAWKSLRHSKVVKVLENHDALEKKFWKIFFGKIPPILLYN